LFVKILQMLLKSTPRKIKVFSLIIFYKTNKKIFPTIWVDSML
jgi:hypothetical protein